MKAMADLSFSIAQTRHCLFSPDILKALGLVEGKSYLLCLGLTQREVTIHSLNGSTGRIALSSTLFGPTYVPISTLDNVKLNIWSGNGHIYLGPVLGILMNSARLSSPEGDSTIPLHMQAGLAAHFLCYYFSVEDVDWQNSRVYGLTYMPSSGRWVRTWYPLPQVIYDRGAGFTSASKPLVKELRERLRQDTQVQFINALDALGKGPLFEQLLCKQDVSSYLPETIPYDNFADVRKMLERHGFIFLKANYGARGRQVMSVEHTDEGYRVTYYARKLRTRNFKTMRRVRRRVKRFTTGKTFIVQQGIRLLQYKGRPFDMRVLTVKDQAGHWLALSNYARLGKEGLTITNYSAGGDCVFYDSIYAELQEDSSDTRIPTASEIGLVAQRIAAAVEDGFGSFGELGIDLAMDTEGRIWLLEVNTKPDKDLVEGLDDTEGVHPSHAAIFDYARYLCGL